MSLTLIGWILIATSVSISAYAVAPRVARRSRSEPLNLEVWLKSSRTNAETALRGTAGTLILTAMAFAIVAGIGTLSSRIASVEMPDGVDDSDDKLLARLNDYARSIEPQKAAQVPAESRMLPDVEIMIERLATRLESAPGDVQGWRMLGWSYFSTGHYRQAADAYAKAAELDPSSLEIKRAYDQAREKAAEDIAPDDPRPAEETAVARGDQAPPAETPQPSGDANAHETNASIRSMVDRLADRLATAPRDAAGWMNLMRSRVVLGEPEEGANAFRRALDVFKDDAKVSAEISAAAIQLGLRSDE